ncbi:NADP-dependent oxidoreductase domain-containing protein [Mycena olivaceomarginata]|nr:NADP-dependent oxidoreductase domain-containing protein [Mycena olivaceomarginata]
MQNQYSLLYREQERKMIPMLKHFGLGSIPWSLIACGALSRPLSQQSKRVETDAVEEISKKRGISMAQVAVAWVLSKDVVSAPIVGTTSLANLADIVDMPVFLAVSLNLISERNDVLFLQGAIHVQLTEEEIKYLEEPYQPMAIFGH